MTLSPRFALLLAAPALFATACSLDTDKFEFSNADISAAGAAGSAGSSSVGVGGTGGSDVGGAGGTGGSDIGGSGGVDAGGTGGTDIGGSGGTDVGGAAGTTAAGAGGAGAAGEGGAGGATGGSAGSSGTGGGGSGGGLACTESLTGAQRCSSDGAIEECDGTDWVANPVTCANGCVAKGVLAFCKACEPNSVRCTDTLLEVCKADGSGYDVTNAKTCGGALPVCNEAVGDCTQCKQGDAICINGFATTCTAEGVFPLSGGTDCGGASRCVDGACLTAVCASGETKCDASGKVSTCKADLTDFTTPVACPVGSTCVEGRGCLECDFPDGTQFCDGDVATTCTNGKKSINATCGSGQCVVGNNIALCNSCTDGTVICAGNSLQKCVGSTFQEVTACKSGTSCNATLQSCTECTGSDVRCSATGDLQTCGADGTYAVTKACGKPELCDVASQSCFECVPGTTQCTTSGVLQSCSEKGSWLTTKDCGQASLCDAGGNGCIAPECATGETRCDGRQPQVCSKDRRGWEAVGAQCAEACIDFKGDTAHGCVNIESVTAGSNATCAIVGKDDQRLACWGAVAGEPASSQPQFVPDARLVSQVAIGGNFVCAMYGGSVRCWGKNGKGQLGPNLSPGTDSSKPVKVGLPGGQTPAALVAMDQTACALSSSGSTYCWGGGLGGAPDTNKPTLVTDKLSFVELTASGGTVCGKDGMATGYCWGNGVRGKLGNNTGISDAQAPDKPVSTLTLKQIPAPLVPLGSLSSGGAHACAIGTPATGGSPGQAYCWGGNAFGQLGRGSTDNQPHLTAAAVSSSLTFSQLATGDNHTCAITSTGAMVCWGRGTQGQNGQTGGANAPAPTPVTIPESILGGSLTAGSNHSCVATKGKVYCWGDNGSGQLGAGAGKLTSSAAPVAVVFP